MDDEEVEEEAPDAGPVLLAADEVPSLVVVVVAVPAPAPVVGEDCAVPSSWSLFNARFCAAVAKLLRDRPAVVLVDEDAAMRATRRVAEEEDSMGTALSIIVLFTYQYVETVIDAIRTIPYCTYTTARTYCILYSRTTYGTVPVPVAKILMTGAYSTVPVYPCNNNKMR